MKTNHKPSSIQNCAHSEHLQSTPELSLKSKLWSSITQSTHTQKENTKLHLPCQQKHDQNESRTVKPHKFTSIRFLPLQINKEKSENNQSNRKKYISRHFSNEHEPKKATYLDDPSHENTHIFRKSKPSSKSSSRAIVSVSCLSS